ncbi:MAG: tryptophan synthase subunit alpha [Thermococcus sp.]|nr:tryptophan synthase subunit alpha [Thermococcus sp.]
MFESGSIIPYITAGDPSVRATLGFLEAVAEYSGAIELGVPFSDPMADGRTIQASHERALRGGFKLEELFPLVKAFRRNYDTPIILMTYYNPVYRTGVKEFLGSAKASGVDGILVVDLPVSHAGELLETAREEGIKTVFLAAPNTPDERLKEICRASTGFVYLISLYGTTGAREEIPKTAFQLLRRARRLCTRKLAVGFGVSRREHVKRLLQSGADGVVVGSALIRLIEEHGKRAAPLLREKVRELSGL